MSWLSFLTSGAGDLVKQVGDAVDKNITTEEERLKVKSEMARLYTELTIKAYEFDEKDRASARQREVDIKKLGGTNNTMVLLIILLFFGVIFLTYWILTHDLPTGVNEMVTLVLGGLVAKLTDIYGYYFGSSRGSAAKDEIIKKVV